MPIRTEMRSLPSGRLGAATAFAALLLGGTAHAQTPATPLGQIGDVLALSQGEGQQIAKVPTQKGTAEPSLDATPLMPCGPGAKPQPGIDGRVPAGSATDGLHCNVTQVGRQGTSGGFKTHRYTDEGGRTCAYYDTALLAPFNAFKLDASSLGVAVLDMSDPAHPVQTDTLLAAPMVSPHESLEVNQERGLIAAVLGNPSMYPGDVAFYDASADCRHPVKTFEGVIARLGHESGFTQDGRTFYATSGGNSVTAIDVNDPRNPFVVWQGNLTSHGLGLSNDGNRAYAADTSGQLVVVDVSEIQARKPAPQVHEISRLTWTSASIPQKAVPFTEQGHPYLLEFDEYSEGLAKTGAVGAARIIDIADERHPVVVSNMRLAVDNPGPGRDAAADDPGNLLPVAGYAAHYCNIPTRVDPKVVACSFITSGLRIFDISDLRKPKEAGYFVAPTKAVAENVYNPANFSMSQPTFDVARHDVWYTDGASGFFAVHLDDTAWPAATAATSASAGTCQSKRQFTVRVRLPKGAKVKAKRARVAGRTLAVKVSGRTATTVVKLKGLPRKTVQLVVRVTLRGGRVVTARRTYHPCQRRLGSAAGG